MRWQTETSLPEFQFNIDHKSNILLLGSCFAENIGDRLHFHKFKTVQNPFGIVYNPISLLHTLRVLVGDKMYSSGDVQLANSRYFSYDHHSRFSAARKEETLENINTELETARHALSQTNVAFISLGTAFYWWLNDEERVVNNCHKQPLELFAQKRASVEDVRSALTEVVLMLQKSAPAIQIVFTVSPIRHLKHGSQGNQLSKATLVVAAQELAERMENVHYFPSYELLLDDLRDYRWYEEDLIHPNKMAIDYIWEKFGDAFFTTNTRVAIKDVSGFQKLLNHRPLNASLKNKAAQFEKLSAEAARIQKKYDVLFKAELNCWREKNL